MSQLLVEGPTVRNIGLRRAYGRNGTRVERVTKLGERAGRDDPDTTGRGMELAEGAIGRE
ncbi:hypothetical protein X777_13854 [Ooceraea biroi]|uniref:Uncharacterized protein n=1 Tax=Ooceraea biroi TaxID=2015173 RepID=A0A026VXE3_OOCBI|nr:hypothetical protein X777_13854 [Ooceraea biroi]